MRLPPALVTQPWLAFNLCTVREATESIPLEKVAKGSSAEPGGLQETAEHSSICTNEPCPTNQRRTTRGDQCPPLSLPRIRSTRFRLTIGTYGDPSARSQYLEMGSPWTSFALLPIVSYRRFQTSRNPRPDVERFVITDIRGLVLGFWATLH